MKAWVFTYFIVMTALLASRGWVHAQGTSQGASNSRLDEKLEKVRIERLAIEKALIEAEKTKKNTEKQLSRLKSLQQLQTQEKAMTEARMKELQRYLDQLSDRKQEVMKRVKEAQTVISQKLSKIVHPILLQHEKVIRGEEGEGVFYLKRQAVLRWFKTNLKSSNLFMRM